jgi:hypothetical protein
MATLSCLLSDASLRPRNTKWLRSDGSEATGKGFTSNTSIPYRNGEQTIELVVDPAKESASFTCCFEFAEGGCKEGVANLEVVKEDGGIREDTDDEEEDGDGKNGVKSNKGKLFDFR